jgi:hypothetical protein
MSVAADSLDVVDNGARVTFIGRVSAEIDDRDSKAAAASRRPAAPAATPVRPALPEPSALAPAGAGRNVTVIDPATGRALPRSVP